MKYPPPELTRYVHKSGFRYQVDVGKVDTGIITSLGHRKFYETENQAIEAASHEVLYLLLIQELQELQEATIAASRPEHENMSTLSSQLPTPTTDSLLSAKTEYPSISNNGGSGRDMSKPVNDRVLRPIHSVNAPHRVTKAAHPQSKRSNACPPSISTLSNLVPVTNPRLSTEKVRDEPQPDRKWKASPDQLTKAIAGLETSRAKYESEDSTTIENEHQSRLMYVIYGFRSMQHAWIDIQNRVSRERQKTARTIHVHGMGDLSKRAIPHSSGPNRLDH